MTKPKTPQLFPEPDSTPGLQWEDLTPNQQDALMVSEPVLRYLKEHEENESPTVKDLKEQK